MKNRLREIRKAKGISMCELVRRSGVSRMTLYKIESGNEQSRTTRTLQKIAKALDMPVAEIFEI